MDLSELRKEIDEIDDQLIPLLLRRFDIAQSVAETNGIIKFGEEDNS